MRIIKNLTDLSLNWQGKKSAVAIGKFDGIHLGHRLLIEEIVKQKSSGMIPVVFTFDPDPASFFAGRRLPALADIKEKRRILESMGVEVLIEYPMTKENAEISGREFVEEFLIGRMNTGLVAAGPDLSFGDRGRGNIALLSEYAEKTGMVLKVIDKLRQGENVISSSLIKQKLGKGSISEANAMLGRRYSLSGTVEHGRQLGKTIGFPTANLSLSGEKVLPAKGVYAGFARECGTDALYPAICNIGTKPTVKDDSVVNIEIHLLNFDGDLYGRSLEYEFLDYLRDEKRFDSLDELKNQLEKDKKTMFALAKQ